MLILCSQISVILAICFYCIREARKAYENDTSFAGMYFRGSMNMNKQLDLVPYSPSPEYYPSEMFKQVQSKDNPTKLDTLIVMAMNSDHRIELIKDGYMDKSGGVTISMLHFFYGLYRRFCALYMLPPASVLRLVSSFLQHQVSLLDFYYQLLCLRWMKMMALML